MIASWLPLIGLLLVSNVVLNVPLQVKQKSEGPFVVYEDFKSAEEFESELDHEGEFDELFEIGTGTTVEADDTTVRENEAAETKLNDSSAEVVELDVSNVTQTDDHAQTSKNLMEVAENETNELVPESFDAFNETQAAETKLNASSAEVVELDVSNVTQTDEHAQTNEIDRGFFVKETVNEADPTTNDSTTDVQAFKNLLEVAANETYEIVAESFDSFNETQTNEESQLKLVNNEISDDNLGNATQDSNETQPTESTSKLPANEITEDNETETAEALNQTEVNEMTTIPVECETNFECDLEELNRTGSCLCGKYVKLPEELPEIVEGDLNQTDVQPPIDEQSTVAKENQTDEAKQHEDQPQSEDAVVMETTHAQEVTSESVSTEEHTESAGAGQAKDENLVKLLLEKLLHKPNRPSVRLNDYHYVTALKSFDGSLYVPQNHEQSTRAHLTTLFGFVEKILKSQNGVEPETDETPITEAHLSTTDFTVTPEPGFTLSTLEPHETSEASDRDKSEFPVNHETDKVQTTPSLAVVGVLNELDKNQDPASPVEITSTTSPDVSDMGNMSKEVEDFSTGTVPRKVSEISSEKSTEWLAKRSPDVEWVRESDNMEEHNGTAEEWLTSLDELGLGGMGPSFEVLEPRANQTLF